VELLARFNREQLKRPPPLAILLIAAIGAVDAVGLLIVRSVERYDELLPLLSIAECGLIGVWAGLGSLRGLIRFPLAVAAISLAVAVASLAGMRRSNSSDWFTPFLGCGSMAATAAIGLLATRATGLRLVRAVEGEPAATAPARRFQFSMLQAMIAMTEVGVLAALLKLAYQNGYRDGPVPITATLGQGAVMGFLVLLAAEIAFGRRWANVRLIVAAGFLWGVAWGLMQLSHGAPRGQFYILSFATLLTAMIAAPLAVFRVCGYQFERTARKRSAGAADPIRATGAAQS
jgi:hypothetical protein